MSLLEMCLRLNWSYKCYKITFVAKIPDSPVGFKTIAVDTFFEMPSTGWSRRCRATRCGGLRRNYDDRLAGALP